LLPIVSIIPDSLKHFFYGRTHGVFTERIYVTGALLQKQSNEDVYREHIVQLSVVAAAATHADSVLGLVEERVGVLVGVAAQGVADPLATRLFAVGLRGRGDGVGLALDKVAGLLESSLLGVGLHGGASFVGERLTTGVRHD